MKLTKYNEAIIPLELEEGEFLATRPFDVNNQEFITFKANFDTKMCEITSRDKLYYADHREHITKMVAEADYHLIDYHSAFIVPDFTNKNRKCVFQIDVKAVGNDELIELKVVNSIFIGLYPRFDGQVLYSQTGIS